MTDTKKEILATINLLMLKLIKLPEIDDRIETFALLGKLLENINKL